MSPTNAGQPLRLGALYVVAMALLLASLSGAVRQTTPPVATMSLFSEVAPSAPAASTGTWSGKVLANLTVGTGPNEPFFDPVNGNVYVSNEYNANMSVVSGTSELGTIAQAGGESTVVDTTTGDVYSSSGGAVAVLSGTSIVASPKVGSGVVDEVYDSGNGDVYVSSYISQNITVIQGTRDVGSIPLPYYPMQMAYDNGNGYVYVQCSNNVTVISGTAIVASLTDNPTGAAGAGFGIVYDASTGDIYDVRGNSVSGNASVIQGTRFIGSISLGADPGGIGVDPANGNVYISSGSGITAVSGIHYVQNFSGNYGGWFTFDRTTGDEVFSSGGILTAINGSTLAGSLSIPATSDESTASALAYDSADGYLYSGGGGCNSLPGQPPCTPGRVYVISTTVIPPPANSTSGGGFLGLNGDSGVLLVVGFAAALIAVFAVIILVRRRKRETPQGPETQSQGSPYPGYAPGYDPTYVPPGAPQYPPSPPYPPQ